MHPRRNPRKPSRPSDRRRDPRRRGVITVLAVASLPVIFAFVAMAVDSGRISLERTKLQMAVDAAALAASQEITGVLEEAAETGGDATVDANSIAVDRARQTAADVAERNGVYIDPDSDVTFGKRVFDEQTGEWPITWDAEPYNVVRVCARRDNPNTSQPDGRFPLVFGWAVGKPSVEIEAAASAFVEARDIVVVLDFSGSMNDDSEISQNTIDKLGVQALAANLVDCYNALGANTGSMTALPRYVTLPGQPLNGGSSQASVTFKNRAIEVTSDTTIQAVALVFSDANMEVFWDSFGYSAEVADPQDAPGWEDDRYERTVEAAYVLTGGSLEYCEFTNSAVLQYFGLNSIPYPYPSGSWNAVVNHCRNDVEILKVGCRNKFGGVLWVDYLLSNKYLHSRTPDLWKTPHYPFNAVKNGATLFFDFLTDMDFGDQVGIVSYATYARWEDELYEDGYNIDLSDDPISPDYESVNQIQRHKQAGHYANTTAIGDGLLKAREMLQEHIRYGARPTILLMTDGLANVCPGGWSLPADFDWAEWTDYDGDGYADYTTSNRKKQYAFYQATEAIRRGISIHTMSVGLNADEDLMEAIAFAGSGVWIAVEGGTTIAEMEEEMVAAFRQIASRVPPPKLVYDEGVDAP